jgi:hypothetical protein
MRNPIDLLNKFIGAIIAYGRRKTKLRKPEWRGRQHAAKDLRQ